MTLNAACPTCDIVIDAILAIGHTHDYYQYIRVSGYSYVLELQKAEVFQCPESVHTLESGVYKDIVSSVRSTPILKQVEGYKASNVTQDQTVIIWSKRTRSDDSPECFSVDALFLL